jgi:hypothetical protein
MKKSSSAQNWSFIGILFKWKVVPMNVGFCAQKEDKLMRLLALTLFVCCFSFPVFAQDDTDTSKVPVSIVENTNQGPASAGQQQPTGHPAATTYSNAYEVRLKIHKYASIATLPLFATELALGQSLYNNPETGAKKTAHGIVGAGIVGVFGVNTATGVWNLWEGRHDTDGRNKRIVHSVLMLASTGGFLGTMATAPHIHNGVITNPSDKSLHRNIAVASMGAGTAGYLLMLFKGH